MQEYMRVCPICIQKPRPTESTRKIVVPGWFDYFKNEECAQNMNCIDHPNQQLIKVAMTCAEFQIFRFISNDLAFMANMSNLKMSDPTEYYRRLEEYRPQAEQNKIAWEQERERLDRLVEKRSRARNYDKEVRCPKCGSASVTAGARGVNWTFGLIGASKTVNRCGNCGHSWKPRG